MGQLEIKPHAERDEPLRFERLLAEISTFFINLPADRIDSEIEAAQHRVCEFLDLDRSTLFQMPEGEPGSPLLTHIHQPPGSRLPPERMSLKEFFPWTTQAVMGGETVTISKMTDFPAEAGRDRETCDLYGTRAVVVVPLSIGRRKVFGALTFSVVREEREWPETLVQQFKLVAQIFANALARKQTEEALREGKEKLNIVTDAAGAGLWIMGLDTDYVWVTPKTRELFHFAPDEALNYESFFKVIHPDDHEKVQQAVQQAIQSGEDLRSDFRIVLPDGSIRWMVARGQGHLRSTGKSDRLMGVSIDITERKLAEEALRERLQFEHLLSGLSAGC